MQIWKEQQLNYNIVRSELSKKGSSGKPHHTMQYEKKGDISNKILFAIIYNKLPSFFQSFGQLVLVALDFVLQVQEQDIFSPS